MNKRLILTLVFIFLSMFASLGNGSLKHEIKLEEVSIQLTESDYSELESFLFNTENPKLPYEEVTLKEILVQSVYLLSAIKHNYYGVHVVLSKEGNKWVALKEVPYII